MIAADQPAQRPADAKLLVVDGKQHLHDVPRHAFVDLLRPGDLVVANDAATLPASLHGIHLATGSFVEVRLAGRRTLETDDVSDFLAIVFGAGDFRTRTENRPAPPPLAPGDRLLLGPLIGDCYGDTRPSAVHLGAFRRLVQHDLGGHRTPRPADSVRASGNAVSAVGCLDPIAGRPAAFEPPSAGFALNWRTMAALHEHGIGFTTITHAAGISSTGDEELDSRLPLDEPYRFPKSRQLPLPRRGRQEEESSRSAPLSSARSSMRPRRMVTCAPDVAWRISASGRLHD